MSSTLIIRNVIESRLPNVRGSQRSDWGTTIEALISRSTEKDYGPAGWLLARDALERHTAQLRRIGDSERKFPLLTRT
jgi:hypothetical protein